MGTQDRKLERLPLLDGLRGLAAIAVMLYHADNIFMTVGPFRRCYLFVDFFFLLSGFVLALAYEGRMRAGLGSIGFLRARIIRLWPVIAIGVALGAACQAILGGGAELALLLIMGLLMLPQMGGGGQIFPLNGPQWSLMLELFANLAHGLLLRRLGNRGLLAVAAISAAALAMTIAWFGSNTLGPFSFNWWYALPRVAFSYTAGVWLGRQWQERPRRSRTSWLTAFLLPTLCVIILANLPLRVAWGDMFTVIVLFPPLLWLAATAEIPIWSRSWLDRLGALSFPLYAVHLPIIGLVSLMGNSPTFWLLAVACPLIAAQLLVWAAQGPIAGKAAPDPQAARLT